MYARQILRHGWNWLSEFSQSQHVSNNNSLFFALTRRIRPWGATITSTRSFPSVEAAARRPLFRDVVLPIGAFARIRAVAKLESNRSIVILHQEKYGIDLCVSKGKDWSKWNRVMDLVSVHNCAFSGRSILNWRMIKCDYQIRICTNDVSNGCTCCTYIYTYMDKGKDSLTHAPCLSLDIYIHTYIHSYFMHSYWAEGVRRTPILSVNGNSALLLLIQRWAYSLSSANGNTSLLEEAFCPRKKTMHRLILLRLQPKAGSNKTMSKRDFVL